MITDSSFEFVFYHIPKCGGTSLRTFFKQLYLTNGFHEEDIYVSCNALNKSNIMNSDMLDKMLPVLNNTKIVLAHINHKLYPRLPSKFNITCIRNPINRFISSFNHFTLQSNPDYNLEHLYLDDRVQFDKLCTNCYTCPSKIWFRNNILDFNFIIIFENIDADLKYVTNMLKFTTSIDVPHIDPCKQNKHNPNHFKFDMNNHVHKEMYEYITQRLSRDISIYNKICNFRSLGDNFLIK